jgi:hypothetical protein
VPFLWCCTAKASGHAVTLRSSPTVFADTPISGSTSTRILSGKLLKRSNAFGFVSHRELLDFVAPNRRTCGNSLQLHSNAGEAILIWTGIRDAPITSQLARCLVTEHKFRIGQLVYFHPKGTWRSQVDAASGPYQITRRLPAAVDGELQYEVRSAVEDHNRVAKESELTRQG